jgi:hypothetical protein
MSVKKSENIIKYCQRKLKITGITPFIPAGEGHWHGAIKDSSSVDLSTLAMVQE